MGNESFQVADFAPSLKVHVEWASVCKDFQLNMMHAGDEEENRCYHYLITGRTRNVDVVLYRMSKDRSTTSAAH